MVYLSSTDIYKNTFKSTGFLGQYDHLKRNFCIPMFTAALFTIAKLWKQLNVYRRMHEKKIYI